MWDFEKINSQNLEVQETKNIVRHPEGVLKEVTEVASFLLYIRYLGDNQVDESNLNLLKCILFHKYS